MTKEPRKPQSFVFDEPGEKPVEEGRMRKPGAFDAGIVLTPDELDPFLGTADALPPPPPRPRRGLPLVKIFLAALGTILSIGFGLWLDGLIRALFSRADWLGYTAIAITALGILALVGMVLREWLGMRRLSAVQALKAEAEDALRNRMPAPARTVVEKLVALSERLPETAAGRAALARTTGEIIDAEGLLALAEIELLGPTDRKVRQLILNASKRVSVVTAVSPRALVDLGYVLFEASRLVRAIAEAYGTHPGRLGMLRLFRDVVAHLAVTGSIAVGDSLVQQVLGHGLASKLSARLGEGVVNGLMTARIGIAAMDLLRPLPFKAMKRPGIGDFLGDLAGIKS
ncbi:MAG: TIGR01620 family protein [Rhizobium sp.]|nr:TIGR01620 family protein [Rhizobium sp.]